MKDMIRKEQQKSMLAEVHTFIVIASNCNSILWHSEYACLTLYLIILKYFCSAHKAILLSTERLDLYSAKCVEFNMYYANVMFLTQSMLEDSSKDNLQQNIIFIVKILSGVYKPCIHVQLELPYFINSNLYEATSHQDSVYWTK